MVAFLHGDRAWDLVPRAPLDGLDRTAKDPVVAHDESVRHDIPSYASRFELNPIVRHGALPVERAAASLRLFAAGVVPELHSWERQRRRPLHQSLTWLCRTRAVEERLRETGVRAPMTAPGESALPTETHASHVAEFRKQGALAGLFGAFLLAGWFLYLDMLRDKPLFTPTLLGAALLGREGTGALQTLRGSVPLTLLFTMVHGLVFVAIGTGATYLLERFALVRHRALIILLIFGVLCLGFFAFAANVSAIGPQTIAVRDAFVGNAIAALGMGIYLARMLPPSPPPSGEEPSLRTTTPP